MFHNSEDSLIAEELILFMYDMQAIRIGDYTLSSGKTSGFYIDLRILQSYPIFFRKAIYLLKKYIINKIGMDSVDNLCSIPTSGTIFGSALSYELFKPHIYIRKNVKSYGTRKTFEGTFERGANVLFIDDVVTTGNSLLAGIDLVRNDSIIDNVLVLIDREQGAKEMFLKNGIKLNKIISITDIFETLQRYNKIDNRTLDKLKNELEKI